MIFKGIFIHRKVSLGNMLARGNGGYLEYVERILNKYASYLVYMYVWSWFKYCS